MAANEATFASLKVGDHTYENVRLTSKRKKYIIISHAEGITSIKVSDLPDDVLQKLGYSPRPKPKEAIKGAAMWAAAAVPKVEMATTKPIEAGLSQAWGKTGLASPIQLLKLHPGLIPLVAAILLAVHLFYSYCCMLICQKTRNNPRLSVFVPLVQTFPMLRAASMSPWWFIACFIPGLNLVAYVIWCLKIVDARQKTKPLALLLICPLTAWFAFLFLAFSEVSGPKIITVETALIKFDVRPDAMFPVRGSVAHSSAVEA